MELTTTHTFEGKKIVAYKGLVTGETILGANIVKDFFASIRDIVGGRSDSYEKTVADAREISIREMSEKAAQLGANAIVGIDLDYQNIEGMLMVTATGTAVVLE